MAAAVVLVVTALALIVANLGMAIPNAAKSPAEPTSMAMTAPTIASTEAVASPAAHPNVPVRQSGVTPTPTPPAPTEEAPAPVPGANELGRIPVFMYHAFVHNIENTDEWTLTLDQFRAQLDWFLANDFVAVGINSAFVDREFDIPAGKRPVVLTFDDASARQFGLREAAGGGYEPDPNTAVGVLEEYRAAHPGFIQSAFFAVLPFNCFPVIEGDDDPSTCEERLTWLVEHGYEIGNHTRGHQNLSQAGDELIKEEILEPIAWFAERIEGPNNLSDVLVLPFGMYPSEQYQIDWLFDGFWHEGEFFVPRLVLEVTGGPTRSPFHTESKTNLTRINTDPATFQYWTEQIETGEVEIFVSDGDPAYVTIPDGWESKINEAILTEDSRQLLVHPPESAAS